MGEAENVDDDDASPFSPSASPRRKKIGSFENPNVAY
jgi:hypothetical protein